MNEMFAILSGTAAALPAALTPSNFIFGLAGLTFGVIWGAMPALSATMAMALLVGFSSGLPMEAAIMFLLGVYSGSVSGGSISAVCINIPGTPNAVCTAMEGYPLFKRGEGGQALGTAIFASAVGNIFGTVMLILFAPFVLALAISVGAWELFLLGLMGVLISGSISDAPPLKGWLSGLIGLAIALVGIDPLSGLPRFTMGMNELYGGISFIAVLIGLFGFTEIARGLLFEKDHPAGQLNRVQVNWFELKRNIGNLIRSSGIGTIVGVIPAAGADIASFLAYTISRRFAKPEERALYGKGSYRGIIASETSDNASVGGSLLPSLLLAIPGSTVAAAFMGALNLQGIVVGPMIQMSHPGLLEFIFAALLITSILLRFVCYFLAKPSVRLLSIPRRILLPCIVPMCVMGAFAAQNSVFDIYVMAIAGFAGIALVSAGFPLAPICMGLILGPIVDLNFRRALIVYKDQALSDMLLRPVSLVLLTIIALVVIGSLTGRQRPAVAG
jgi:putative tricarboxylic transport membrane protein